MTRDWDIDWEYWDAQTEGFKEALRKPIWRDYLETQRRLLDEVHDFFWKKEVYERGGESQEEEEESNEEPERRVGKKLSPPVPPVNTPKL